MKNICYESTKECNLNCDYCISSDNGKRGEKEIDYVQIIDAITKFSPQRIVISGGEPLMDKKLLDKLKLIREKCPNSFVSISTNGSVPVDYLELKDYVDCLDFSLPALDENIYKSMRGKNCVAQVVQNIIKAKEQNINLRLSYTLTKVNSGQLQAVLDFAEEKKISEVRIGRFFPFRDAQFCKDKYELSESEISQIMDNIKKDNYSFRLVPPIANLDLMENGYITINYCGEIFLPTREGKKCIGQVNDLDENLISGIVDEQNKIFINTNMKKDKQSYYNTILAPMRIRKSGSNFKRSVIEEFYSDRSRIIYSQEFRRLQQKAQVFSLETNSSVRSRLSHSIEVSDVGRLMAKKITEKLCALPEDDIYRLEREDAEKIVAIVENACLLHDIGNPPFGHFGEAAIQNWWVNNYKKYLKLYNKRAKKKSEDAIAYTTKRQKQLLEDIAQFDGNPQGLRTILRLKKDEVLKEEPNKELLESGMNLSYQTVLSCVKYVICAGEPAKKNMEESLQKKAGYFQSEKNILTKMYEDLGLSMDKRFPFVYIMEAADDISYCMSDVADSIEKDLTSLKYFLADFCEIWKKFYNEEVPEDVIDEETRKGINNGTIKDFNHSLASIWAANMTSEAARIFVEKRKDFFGGSAGEVVKEESGQFKVLKVISEYSRQKIYRAVEAEEIEIAGYAIISGLLTCFGQLLTLTGEEFQKLLDADFNPKKEKLEVESRICHLLGDKYITSYKNQLKEWKGRLKDEKLQEAQVEWWLRAHLIVDHVAGMTDEFALRTYQLCKGINVSIF